MLAAKYKPGIAVMVEPDFLPAADRMAGLAFLAILTLVAFFLVVFAMAGYAGGRKLVGNQLRFVTGLAFNLDMLAFERILGIAVMVEGDVLPVFGGVAGFTLATVLSLVTFLVVVFFVAGHAFHWRAGVDLVRMAFLALDVAMA